MGENSTNENRIKPREFINALRNLLAILSPCLAPNDLYYSMITSLNSKITLTLQYRKYCLSNNWENKMNKNRRCLIFPGICD